MRSSRNESSGILATDLDGTLIPLDGNHKNRIDLQTLTEELRANNVTLVFSTGRHLESVIDAIENFHLPIPDWIICDVGTSLVKRRAVDQYELVGEHQKHLDQLVTTMPLTELKDRLTEIDGLRVQENEKQGRFKLSYYTDAASLEIRVEAIQRLLDRTQAPYSIIHSVDPFNGDGLIDLLPKNVSKAHALAWWVDHVGVSADTIVFAGDSGNDLAALTSGCRAIVVGNADRSLAEQVCQFHRQQLWQNRLFLANEHASSGVLEGCRQFGLTDSAFT